MMSQKSFIQTVNISPPANSHRPRTKSADKKYHGQSVPVSNKYGVTSGRTPAKIRKRFFTWGSVPYPIGADKSVSAVLRWTSSNATTPSEATTNITHNVTPSCAIFSLDTSKPKVLLVFGFGAPSAILFRLTAASAPTKAAGAFPAI